jgi:hypothetical protein
MSNPAKEIDIITPADVIIPAVFSTARQTDARSDQPLIERRRRELGLEEGEGKR